MTCDFLIVFDGDTNVEAGVQTLIDALSEALQNDLDEIDDDVIAACLEIPIDKVVAFTLPDATTIENRICNFTLNVPEEVENVEMVIDNFAGLLQFSDGVKHVLKFYDEHLLAKNLEFVPKLFDLEMKLRKAISIVYLATFPDGYYDLLREDTIDALKTNGDKLTGEQLSKVYENEFFHLTFSQYVALNRFKPIKNVERLLEKMTQADCFETFRDGINHSPIQKEEYQDFIASLTETLNAIEKLRNCVMHNRTPSTRIIEDFDRSFQIATENIDSFLDSFSTDE